MPYGVWHVGDEYCVYKKDPDGNRSGKTLGCHPTTGEAENQIAAIGAASHASRRFTMRRIRQRDRPCRNCGSASRRLRQQLGGMPQQMLEGLCKKFMPDEGFFTRCMESSLGGYAEKLTSQEAFCARLHKECIGKWPAERSLTTRRSRFDQGIFSHRGEQREEIWARQKRQPRRRQVVRDDIVIDIVETARRELIAEIADIVRTVGRAAVVGDSEAERWFADYVEEKLVIAFTEAIETVDYFGYDL